MGFAYQLVLAIRLPATPRVSGTEEYSVTTGPADAVAGAITARVAFAALRGTEAVAIGEAGATEIVATGDVSGASFDPAWTDHSGRSPARLAAQRRADESYRRP